MRESLGVADRRQRSARRFRRCPTFPIDQRVPGAGGPARQPRATTSSRCRRRPGRAAPHAAHRHARVHAEGTAADAHGVRRSRRHRSCGGCSCRSAISPTASEPIPAGRYLDLDERRPASTISTSTAPIIRSASSTPSTTARCRRARTGCRFRSAPASGCADGRRSARSSSTSTACLPTPSRCTCAPYQEVLDPLGISLTATRTTTRPTWASTT